MPTQRPSDSVSACLICSTETREQPPQPIINANYVLVPHADLEYPVHPLCDEFLLGLWIPRPPHQVEDGAHDVLHLLAGDQTVAVLEI